MSARSDEIGSSAERVAGGFATLPMSGPAEENEGLLPNAPTRDVSHSNATEAAETDQFLHGGDTGSSAGMRISMPIDDDHVDTNMLATVPSYPLPLAAPAASSSSSSSLKPAKSIGDDDDSNAVHISIRTLTGQVIDVTVESTAVTVAVLKHAIDMRVGAPSEFQRLLHGGKELVDTHTLASYSIKDGSAVHLVLRQLTTPTPTTATTTTTVTNNASPPTAYYGQRVGGVVGQPIGHDGHGNVVFSTIAHHPLQQQQQQEQRMVPIGSVVQQSIASSAAGVGPDGSSQLINGVVVDNGVDVGRLMAAFQLSRAVRFFAIIDGVILILLSFQNLFLMVGILLVILGYYGARQANRRMIMGYMVYIGVVTLMRVSWAINAESLSLGAVYVFGALVNLYIFTIVARFVRLLRTMTELETATLCLLIAQPRSAPQREVARDTV